MKRISKDDAKRKTELAAKLTVSDERKRKMGETKTQHAPGPWTAEDESLNAITIRATSKSARKLGREIASVMDEDGNALTPRMWADARLIAAAPTTYAALTKIYYDNEAACGCDCDTETCCNRVGEPCPKCDARAALAASRRPARL